MKTIKVNGKWYNLPDEFVLVERINFQTNERERVIVGVTDNIQAELYDDMEGKLYLTHPDYKMKKFYLSEKTS